MLFILCICAPLGLLPIQKFEFNGCGTYHLGLDKCMKLDIHFSSQSHGEDRVSWPVFTVIKSLPQLVIEPDISEL